MPFARHFRRLRRSFSPFPFARSFRSFRAVVSHPLVLGRVPSGNECHGITIHLRSPSSCPLFLSARTSANSGLWSYTNRPLFSARRRISHRYQDPDIRITGAPRRFLPHLPHGPWVTPVKWTMAIRLEAFLYVVTRTFLFRAPGNERWEDGTACFI